TDKMEKQANEIFDQIDALGGVIPAIEAGYFQKEIANAAYQYQKEVERKEKFIVGVNEFIEEDTKVDIPILYISPEVEKKQRKRLGDLRQSRNSESVSESLKEIKDAAINGTNIMPVLVKAAHNYVTLGEMVNQLKDVYGVYEEAVVF
ncbi:MAG: methylmalonyl-CoA mutase family protein, partial [Ignavibacteria bacterium]|nr:methylmalonyl-CoA mutase family protein [Ignavibacteria bacterium]